jgi:hypothetical protein
VLDDDAVTSERLDRWPEGGHARDAPALAPTLWLGRPLARIAGEEHERRVEHALRAESGRSLGELAAACCGSTWIRTACRSVSAS